MPICPHVPSLITKMGVIKDKGALFHLIVICIKKKLEFGYLFIKVYCKSKMNIKYVWDCMHLKYVHRKTICLYLVCYAVRIKNCREKINLMAQNKMVIQKMWIKLSEFMGQRCQKIMLPKHSAHPRLGLFRQVDKDYHRLFLHIPGISKSFLPRHNCQCRSNDLWKT